MNVASLLKDFYLWIGLGLFVLSVVGIVWIMKSLRNQPDSDTIMGEEPQDMPKVTGADDSLNIIPIQDAHPTLESISIRLSHMEEILTKIEQKLDQGNGAEISAVTDEVKALLQALRSDPNNPAGTQLSQLSSKVDKIYQVLASLSGSSTEKG